MLHFPQRWACAKLRRSTYRMPLLKLWTYDPVPRNGSTLITSQFPVEQWHEVIADATVADAILDRLVHNAYRLDLKGESVRKTKNAIPGKTP